MMDHRSMHAEPACHFHDRLRALQRLQIQAKGTSQPETIHYFQFETFLNGILLKFMLQSNPESEAQWHATVTIRP